jgi:pimeloyl-ACP methyl ester carboxylesterase
MPGLLDEAAPQELREELMTMVADPTQIGYPLMARTIADLDTRDLLPRICISILPVWGDADERAPISIAHQLREAIPRGKACHHARRGTPQQSRQPAPFNAQVRAFCHPS